MNYPHLTREERYQIYALKKAGHTQSEIATVIDRSVSTISRELARNRGARGYRPKQAHNKAVERKAINARVINDATWQFAQEKLMLQWSPDQISNYADISIETVYQRVYADKRNGGILWKNLRCQKQRRKRYGKTDRRGIIPNRQSIEQRPAIVDARSRIGDWEADTLIGKNHRQAIASLVERKTGYTLIRKVERKTAEAVIKNHPPAQATPKTGAYDYFRQRAGIRRTQGDQQTTGCGFLFRPPLRFMGTRDQREYQWTDSAVLPQKPGLHHDYTTGDGYSNGKIEQSTQKTTWIPNT